MDLKKHNEALHYAQYLSEHKWSCDILFFHLHRLIRNYFDDTLHPVSEEEKCDPTNVHVMQ